MQQQELGGSEQCYVDKGSFNKYVVLYTGQVSPTILLQQKTETIHTKNSV
jgi:hypothetical protein